MLRSNDRMRRRRQPQTATICKLPVSMTTTALFCLLSLVVHATWAQPMGNNNHNDHLSASYIEHDDMCGDIRPQNGLDIQQVRYCETTSNFPVPDINDITSITYHNLRNTVKWCFARCRNWRWVALVISEMTYAIYVKPMLPIITFAHNSKQLTFILDFIEDNVGEKYLFIPLHKTHIKKKTCCSEQLWSI